MVRIGNLFHNNQWNVLIIVNLFQDTTYLDVAVWIPVTSEPWLERTLGLIASKKRRHNYIYIKLQRIFYRRRVKGSDTKQ